MANSIEIEQRCGYCANCIHPIAGMNKGKALCVCEDPKNPDAPHVHVTQDQFKCSTNRFKPKQP